MLCGGREGDILSQYVLFCKIADSCRREYGRSQKAIDETIRRCMEAGVLVPFLASRKKEVQDIMVTLLDNQTISEIHDYHIALEARREGMQKGMQRGQQKGREEGIRAAVSMLQELSIDRETVVQKLAVKFNLLPHVAEEKVAQYWVQ